VNTSCSQPHLTNTVAADLASCVLRTVGDQGADLAALATPANLQDCGILPPPAIPRVIDTLYVDVACWVAFSIALVGLFRGSGGRWPIVLFVIAAFAAEGCRLGDASTVDELSLYVENANSACMRRVDNTFGTFSRSAVLNWPDATEREVCRSLTDILHTPHRKNISLFDVCGHCYVRDLLRPESALVKNVLGGCTNANSTYRSPHEVQMKLSKEATAWFGTSAFSVLDTTQGVGVWHISILDDDVNAILTDSTNMILALVSVTVVGIVAIRTYVTNIITAVRLYIMTLITVMIVVTTTSWLRRATRLSPNTLLDPLVPPIILGLAIDGVFIALHYMGTMHKNDARVHTIATLRVSTITTVLCIASVVGMPIASVRHFAAHVGIAILMLHLFQRAALLDCIDWVVHDVTCRAWSATISSGIGLLLLWSLVLVCSITAFGYGAFVNDFCAEPDMYENSFAPGTLTWSYFHNKNTMARAHGSMDPVFVVDASNGQSSSASPALTQFLDAMPRDVTSMAVALLSQVIDDVEFTSAMPAGVVRMANDIASQFRNSEGVQLHVHRVSTNTFPVEALTGRILQDISELAYSPNLCVATPMLLLTSTQLALWTYIPGLLTSFVVVLIVISRVLRVPFAPVVLCGVYVSLVVFCTTWRMPLNAPVAVAMVLGTGLLIDYAVHVSYDHGAVPAVISSYATTVASIAPYCFASTSNVRAVADVTILMLTAGAICTASMSATGTRHTPHTSSVQCS
jgi:hypothetical protein